MPQARAVGLFGIVKSKRERGGQSVAGCLLFSCSLQGRGAAHTQAAHTTEFALALGRRAAGSGTGCFPAHHGRTSVMAKQTHVAETNNAAARRRSADLSFATGAFPACCRGSSIHFISFSVRVCRPGAPAGLRACRSRERAPWHEKIRVLR